MCGVRMRRGCWNGLTQLRGVPGGYPAISDCGRERSCCCDVDRNGTAKRAASGFGATLPRESAAVVSTGQRTVPPGVGREAVADRKRSSVSVHS